MSDREPFFKPYLSEWLAQQFLSGRLALGLLAFGFAVWWAL